MFGTDARADLACGLWWDEGH